MRHAKDCVVIREIARGVPRAKSRMLDPIVELYRRDRTAWNAEILLDEKHSGAADAIGTRAETTDRKPLIAVVHWDGHQLCSIVPEIFGSHGIMVGVDLSSVNQERRGAALGLALLGLSRGAVDLVICSNARTLLEMSAVDGECIFVNFQHNGMHLTVASKQLPRLATLLAENVTELLPFEFGLSLKETCFIEEGAHSGSSPTEPFQRTLRKLRSLGATCFTDSAVDGPGNHPQDVDKGAFHLAPGWATEGTSDEISVVFSCNDPDEPVTWISLKAGRRSNRTLSVANALLSVVATPEQEWHRWLA
jgi:hypothetical protein